MGNQIKRLIESMIRHIGGVLGRKLRYWYYRSQFKSCGSKIIIEEGVYFENTKHITLGDNTWIDKNAILVAGPFNDKDRKHYNKGEKTIEWGELIVGNNVHIAPMAFIQSHGGVRIGSNVTIASGAKIYSLSHHYKNLNDKTDTKRYSFSSMSPRENQFLIVGNVSIGDNAAIGLNSIILPGATVPNGTWIAVSSVLNGNENLEENTVFY